ncbi:Outer membrane cobalamin receptor protein [Flavobacteriaceae bacterium MAR_2010_188]|nr:Outer membrane cobalamin receptor protein [Flavobacteriaceae bacterium MAR_2010_188]
MKLHFFFILFSCFFLNLHSQNTVSGTVVDNNNVPVAGANVYLEGTYDGANSDENGEFNFKTEAIGTMNLIVSFLSFETTSLKLEVSKMVDLKIVLRENVDALDAVVINAGSFEAGTSKVSVLKPLDVVTTASALADVFGALQTLPGTSTVAEDGRLFVRGGTADETQIFVDGIRVFTPYTPTTNNIPSRGRYSPFLFDGISFSTGGYSAEYGEALSSVLVMNTIDEPDQNKTDIGLMTVGASLGHTEKWDKSSVSVSTSYINLAPYVGIAPDRNDWKKPYESASGETVYRRKFNKGLFRFYAAFDHANFALTQEDINLPEGQFIDLKNENLYLNSNYQGTLNNDWSIFGGGSYTVANSKIGLNEDLVKDKENSIHLKFKLKKRFSSRIKWTFGAEEFYTDFDENYSSEEVDFKSGYHQNITAGFSELEWKFSKSIALNAGFRISHYSLLKQTSLDPRLALAYKISEHSQLSLAYGNFSQSQSQEFLKLQDNLDNQKSTHYIFNYQYTNEGRTLRAELYRKNYDDLLKYEVLFTSTQNNYTTNGYGYAQGLDVFWRDNKTIRNIDYWLSYSYLDTKRNFLDYNKSLSPSFSNPHNFSAVGKLWIDKWKSQVGMSYTFASGRPYTDPNQQRQLSERTKSYNNISLNWAYLISQQKILYISVNNVLGFKNINGYQYSNTPNDSGFFESRTLRPAADQFFFVGFFWTISDNKNDNQLNNL